MGYLSDWELYSAYEKYPKKMKRISEMGEKVHGLSPDDWKELEDGE